MHLKIVSVSEAAQLCKSYSDFDHTKRSWPSAGVLHKEQISVAKGGSLLDSFRQNASENRIDVRGGSASVNLVPILITQTEAGPAQELCILARISLSKSGPVLDLFRPSASKNRINIRGGPVSRIEFRF